MPPFADVLQWEHLPFPKSLRDFQRLFPDDDACAKMVGRDICKRCAASLAKRNARKSRSVATDLSCTEAEDLADKRQHTEAA